MKARKRKEPHCAIVICATKGLDIVSIVSFLDFSDGIQIYKTIAGSKSFPQTSPQSRCFHLFSPKKFNSFEERDFQYDPGVLQLRGPSRGS